MHTDLIAARNPRVACYAADDALYGINPPPGGRVISNQDGCESLTCNCQDCQDERTRLVALGPGARGKPQPWHRPNPQPIIRLPRVDRARLALEHLMCQDDIAPPVHKRNRSKVGTLRFARRPLDPRLKELRVSNPHLCPACFGAPVSVPCPRCKAVVDPALAHRHHEARRRRTLAGRSRSPKRYAQSAPPPTRLS